MATTGGLRKRGSAMADPVTIYAVRWESADDPAWNDRFGSRLYISLGKGIARYRDEACSLKSPAATADIDGRRALPSANESIERERTSSS